MLKASGAGSLTGIVTPKMRAERVQLKSCKDDEIIARGKRGTSAALGKRHKMIPSLFLSLGKFQVKECGIVPLARTLVTGARSAVR